MKTRTFQFERVGKSVLHVTDEDILRFFNNYKEEILTEIIRTNEFSEEHQKMIKASVKDIYFKKGLDNVENRAENFMTEQMIKEFENDPLNKLIKIENLLKTQDDYFDVSKAPIYNFIWACIMQSMTDKKNIFVNIENTIAEINGIEEICSEQFNTVIDLKKPEILPELTKQGAIGDEQLREIKTQQIIQEQADMRAQERKEEELKKTNQTIKSSSATNSQSNEMVKGFEGAYMDSDAYNKFLETISNNNDYTNFLKSDKTNLNNGFNIINIEEVSKYKKPVFLTEGDIVKKVGKPKIIEYKSEYYPRKVEIKNIIDQHLFFIDLHQFTKLGKDGDDIREKNKRIATDNLVSLNLDFKLSDRPNYGIKTPIECLPFRFYGSWVEGDEIDMYYKLLTARSLFMTNHAKNITDALLNQNIQKTGWDIFPKFKEGMPPWMKMKCLFMKTNFYTFINPSGIGSFAFFGDIKGWKKKYEVDKISDYWRIFVPIALGAHWILICIDLPSKTLILIDSFNQNRTNELKVVFDWINMEHKMIGIEGIKWRGVNYHTKPMQQNTADCGIYVLMFSEFLSCSNSIPILNDSIAMENRIRYSNEISTQIITGFEDFYPMEMKNPSVSAST